MTRLTENDVHDYIRGICFKNGPPGLVGVEVEWLVTDPAAPDRPVPVDRVAALLDEAGPPPAGSAVTFEPGGQLELSSPPLPGPAAAHRAAAADLAHVAKPLNDAGLDLRGVGLDPRRPPLRQLTLPRYTAMERFFDRAGPSGRTMMCSTASLQVCLDIGADAADAARRWRLVHRLGPVLTAAFANSPLWRGRPTGWRSARWAVWAGIDQGRTRPVGGDDPATAWTEYALQARLMTIRTDDGRWHGGSGMHFSEWMRRCRPRPPDHDDLAYHLSTLFPPVRPRGWLELRMIDALPAPWWPVPAAVAAALADDGRAADAAEEALDELHGHGTEPDRLTWLAAARDAVADPALGRAARRCLEAASEALPRMGAARLAETVDAYRDLYTERGRCPADDATDGSDAADAPDATPGGDR
ncbi:ergothioneine biosynthesis glutamate--cysteine ligase EgtA [Nocardiopsis suaedae]|uniref:Glutamate--cysteine ligase EgtA n=1 Tax=Nocardiopsis suaedae TaxID=3018444 RepID=A0ABT4TRS3_9ACTN|nr:ergothioneine biosynthesis glutamate--cysteine ligase EgtA [Nocardiopsis suaedae]MDA2807374.1 ergothioneine biosynthesis glutamate--cysteine ligase EgtA [Nocardiopsis suaedae]